MHDKKGEEFVLKESRTTHAVLTGNYLILNDGLYLLATIY